MNILVLADIHGTLHNIKLFLSTNKFDKIIIAGDIFGYFPIENEVIKLICQKNVVLILGNHDLYFIRKIFPDYFYEVFNDFEIELLCESEYSKKYGVIENQNTAYDSLSLDIFKNVQLSRRIQLDGLNFLICHGSPYNPLNQYIFPDYDKFDNIYEDFVFDILILGHTHKSFLKEKNSRFIINPGSCSFPRGEHNPSYAVINTNPLSVQIIDIPQQIRYKKITKYRIKKI